MYYNFAGTVRILEANLPNSAPAVDADNVDITEEGFFYISFANLINLRVVSTLDASGDFGFEYYVWDGERRSSNVDKPRSENAEHADSLLYGTSANPLLSFNVGGENIAPYIWSTDAMGENLEGTRDRLTPIEATVTEDATNEAGNVERDIYIRFADNNTILSHLTTQVALGDAAAQALDTGDANSVTFDTTYGTFTITRDATEGEIDVKYTLDNSSVLIQRLTAEDTRIEEITLSVFDGVHTSERTISVTIQGADDDNDAATASGDFEGSLMANAAETAEGRIVFENEDNEVLTIQVGSANTAIMPDGNQRVAGENGNGFFTLSYDVTNKVLAWQYEAYNSRYFSIDPENIPTTLTEVADLSSDTLTDTLSIRVADDYNDFAEITTVDGNPITVTITPPQDDFTSPLMVTTGGTARPSGYYNASGEGLLAENANGSTTAVGIGTLSGGGEGTLTYAVATGDDITTGLTALGISDIALIARVQVTSTAFSVTSNTLNFSGMNSGNFEAGDFHDVLIKITDQESTETYQLYRVRLSDVNEAPEQIEGEEIIITDSSAMQEITLTEAMLAVRDPDRDDSLVDGRPIAITYTVSTATAGGTLMLDDGMGTLSAVALNGTFTLEDLRAGEVTFVHDGSTVDTVTFTLTATSNTQASTAKTYTLGINAGAADFDFGTAVDDMDGVMESDLTVGNTLHAVRTMSDPDGDGDDNLSYQWLRGDTTNGFDIIDDATGGSYVIDEADDGEFLRVIITYTDGEGYDEEVTITTATLVPIADAGNAVFEFGTAVDDTDGVEASDLVIGNEIFAVRTADDPDGDGTTEPTYQWVRAATIDGTYTAITAISPATSTDSSYTLTEEDDGFFIGVHITYTDGEGTSDTVELDGADNALEIPAVSEGQASFGFDTDGDSIADEITGSLAINTTLAVIRTDDDPDGNGSGTPTYQWIRAATIDGTYTAIGTQTNSSYTLGEDDDGMFIGVVITYTDAENTVENVTIGGVEVAVEDSGDAGFEFGYETDNDNDYSESLADVTTGSLIRVERTGDDSDGNGNVDSAATYTWQRSSDGMENTFTTIEGAPTTNTYTVTSDDQTMYLRAVVEYTDGEGTLESVPIDAVLIPDAV